MSNKEYIWEVLDEAVEIELSGKKYKAHLLPLRAVFAWAESRAVSEALAKIDTVARLLTGKDKRDYLIEATRTLIPVGDELLSKAEEALQSIEAITELVYQSLSKEHKELTLTDVKELVLANADKIESLIQLLIKGLSDFGAKLDEAEAQNKPGK